MKCTTIFSPDDESSQFFPQSDSPMQQCVSSGETADPDRPVAGGIQATPPGENKERHTAHFRALPKKSSDSFVNRHFIQILLYISLDFFNNTPLKEGILMNNDFRG